MDNDKGEAESLCQKGGQRMWTICLFEEKDKAKMILLSTAMLLRRSDKSAQGRQTPDNPKLAVSISVEYCRLRHHCEQSRTLEEV